MVRAHQELSHRVMHVHVHKLCMCETDCIVHASVVIENERALVTCRGGKKAVKKREG